MDIKEIDHRRSSAVVTVSKKGTTEGMRRPFGVAAIDIKSYLLGKLECSLEQEFSIPFVRYVNIFHWRKLSYSVLFSCERENLEQTLRKITNKDVRNDGKNQALFVSFMLLHGGVKQVCSSWFQGQSLYKFDESISILVY